MPWWKETGAKACRFYSDAKNRVPCQMHDCHHYVMVPVSKDEAEPRYQCADLLANGIGEDTVHWLVRQFNELESSRQTVEDLTSARLTGKVPATLMKRLGLEKLDEQTKD